MHGWILGELLGELLNINNYLGGFNYLSWSSPSGISLVVEHNEHRLSLTLKILRFRTRSWCYVEGMTFMGFLALGGKHFSFLVSLFTPCCIFVFVWKLGLPLLFFFPFLLDLPSPYPAVMDLDCFSFLSCSLSSPDFTWAQVVEKTSCSKIHTQVAWLVWKINIKRRRLKRKKS